MAESSLTRLAKNALLDPVALTEGHLNQLIDTMMVPNVDEADIYIQHRTQETWMLEERIVKRASFDIDYGAGLRVVSGEKTGFAYTNELTLATLNDTVLAARSLVKSNEIKPQPVQWKYSSSEGAGLYPAVNPLPTLTEEEKVGLLRRLDEYARGQDERVKEVSISLSAAHDVVLIARSDRQLCADIRPLVRLNVSVIVEEKGRREQGYAGGGGRYDYLTLLKGDAGIHYVDDALRQALLNLEAEDAPAGVMTVVLGPGWPGVLLHESVGHGLESDFNRKGTSIYTGKIGQPVASPLCTVVDDGSIAGRRGSLNIDDEGTPTQKTVLIEKGILRNYMHDRLNARLMKTESTGNGRRESYAHIPIPRMTNTFLLPGTSIPEEIIASVKQGIYAVNFSGGQVDITSGQFVFSMSEAYLIKNGKVTTPIKGATLIGDGSEVLNKVSMVGNDLALDSGIGICGKEGQGVPVGVGQPTVRVDELTVGGTV